MGYSVEYGPPGKRERHSGKQSEIWAEYERLVAAGCERVEIIGPDGKFLDAEDRHFFRLSTVDAPRALGEQ